MGRLNHQLTKHVVHAAEAHRPGKEGSAEGVRNTQTGTVRAPFCVGDRGALNDSEHCQEAG